MARSKDVTYYYTFGADHYDGGTPLQHRYVSVTAPRNADHRMMFMGWRAASSAPNAFASEYSEDEFVSYLAQYQPRRHRAIVVADFDGS